MNLCFYGCGRESIKQFGNGKWCCSESYNSCPGKRRLVSEKLIGRTKENDEGYRKSSETKTGKTKENDESVRKMAETKSGRTKETHEYLKTVAEKNSVHMKNGGAVYAQSFITKEGRRRQAEKSSERMLNGQAARMRKQIRRFSKDELKLREIVKELYPTFKCTYSIFTYDVDIALVEYKIAIEFDGYFHFDTEEHKEYHRRKQQEIEQEGWKFVRYTMFDKFPSKEQVKEDIKKILEVSNDE